MMIARRCNHHEAIQRQGAEAFAYCSCRMKATRRRVRAVIFLTMGAICQDIRATPRVTFHKEFVSSASNMPFESTWTNGRIRPTDGRSVVETVNKRHFCHTSGHYDSRATLLPLCP
jgi:hypothetical protein